MSGGTEKTPHLVTGFLCSPRMRCSYLGGCMEHTQNPLLGDGTPHASKFSTFIGSSNTYHVYSQFVSVVC